ncbi:MAG: M48 family peptidase, partial [Shimia sp.]
MDETIVTADGIAVTVTRSARARRLSLRVSRLDGSARLTLPRSVPLAEGRAFVAAKAGWLAAQAARSAPPIAVGPGTELPFAGGTLRIAAGPRLSAVDGMLTVPEAGAARRVEAWLREAARGRLVAASDRYAAALG